ncbi:MAG: glycosyltransferase family 2 protein, partial [Bacteroidota bacterium]
MPLNNHPLVSVLMTTYNREKYLPDAIESVINSTYQHWELIIVDDVSSDRTVEIARKYELKEERIRVYENEQNLGDYPNRNKAASYAHGKYLKYVDADDLIYPYGLEQLIFYMEKFPEAAFGLCSLEQDEKMIFPFLLEPQGIYNYHYKISSLFHKAPLSSIIKKEVFDKVGGFSGKQHLGDFEMWMMLSKSYHLVLMPHGIVWYRAHDDQQMNDNRTDPHVYFKYLILENAILNHWDCPLDSSTSEILIKQLKIKQSKHIFN